MGFGLFSSSSKSKSSTSTTAQNTGFSDIDGAASNVSVSTGGKSKVALLESGAQKAEFYKSTGNSVTYQALDGGVIAEAFDFAKDISSGSQSVLQGTVSEAVAAVRESARSESENVSIGWQRVVLWSVVVLSVAGGFGFLWRKK